MRGITKSHLVTWCEITRLGFSTPVQYILRYSWYFKHTCGHNNQQLATSTTSTTTTTTTTTTITKKNRHGTSVAILPQGIQPYPAVYGWETSILGLNWLRLWIIHQPHLWSASKWFSPGKNDLFRWSCRSSGESLGTMGIFWTAWDGTGRFISRLRMVDPQGSIEHLRSWIALPYGHLPYHQLFKLGHPSAKETLTRCPTRDLSHQQILIIAFEHPK